MILMRILPGVLKELMKHVPTVLFQVVDWNELVSELPRLSRRILQKEGFESLFTAQKEHLAPFDIILTTEDLTQSKLKLTRFSAEKCLQLYFAQIYSPHGLFLDLRSFHFTANNTEFKWHPSGLWTKFEENFRQGLIQVYDGFYLEDEATYFEGLKRIGLLDELWSDEDKDKLGDLFRAQFGSALTSEMSFDLEHFKNSIIKTTDFLLNKKVKITKDFLYLGIYLVTLYSHLEESGEKLPVRDIFLAVREKLAESKLGR